MRITILGAGCFGLALANVLYKNNTVVVWSREEDYFSDINSKERKSLFLPEVDISEKVRITTDLNDAINNSEIIIIAVASIAIREVLSKLPDLCLDVALVTVAKGVEDSSLLTFSEVVKEYYPKNPILALSGPTHAEELGLGKLAALMIASDDINAVTKYKEAFRSDNLIINSFNNPKGIELCGAFKNLVALVMGISDGYRASDNTKAIIFTKGLEEMHRLCIEVSNCSLSAYTYAGAGDLFATTISQHSRNKKAGALLAKGASFEEVIQEIGQTVEGINNFYSIKELFAKHHLDSKIIKILEEANEKTLTKVKLDEILKEE